MSTLSSFLWGWWAAAALIGFAMGWVAVVHRGRLLSGRTMGWTAAALILLVAAAALHLVPGRPGYWLDLALVMIALYLVGCLIGSALRYAVVSRQGS